MFASQPRGRVIETLKEFVVRAKCNKCGMMQQLPVRWIRLADRTVTAEVFGKACAYCHRWPGDFYVDMKEVISEYREAWGAIAGGGIAS